jgi:hypothetical protein
MIRDNASANTLPWSQVPVRFEKHFPVPTFFLLLLLVLLHYSNRSRTLGKITLDKKTVQSIYNTI